jgi:uncharacterized protein YcbK (DUF882 family)
MILGGLQVNFFVETEFERIEDMYAPLVWELDALRGYVNREVGVSESNPRPSPHSSHASNSRHFVGRAVDCNCCSLPLWDFFLAASRFNFTGIGVYPYWNTPGLHLEIREGNQHKPRNYWWRDHVGAYKAMSVYNVQEIFIDPVFDGT